MCKSLHISATRYIYIYIHLYIYMCGDRKKKSALCHHWAVMRLVVAKPTIPQSYIYIYTCIYKCHLYTHLRPYIYVYHVLHSSLGAIVKKNSKCDLNHVEIHIKIRLCSDIYCIYVSLESFPILPPMAVLTNMD